MNAASASARTDIPDLGRSLETLPMLPAVVSELLSLDPDANEYFDELLHLAERDPAFAARVLRCANSAYSAPLEPIVSLREAFIRLGTHQCARLVLAVAVTKVFAPAGEAQRRLWIHSLQTAMFSRMFCEELRDLRRSRDQAYVCGLLHDIGRFVQLELAPENLRKVDDRAWTSGSEMIDTERERFGFDHTLIGWRVCQRWSLPPAIAAVIHHHHNPHALDGSGPPDMIRVVRWADELSIVLARHPEQAGLPAPEVAAWLAAGYPALGPPVGPQERNSWRDRVAPVFAEARQLRRQLGLDA